MTTALDNMNLEAGGVKHDADKPRMDLLPYDSLVAIAKVFTFGAKKYKDRNWETGMRWGRVFAALQRHMSAWWQREDKDEETGLSHLVHAAFCILVLIAYELRGIGDDDRPMGTGGGDSERSDVHWLATGEVPLAHEAGKPL